VDQDLEAVTRMWWKARDDEDAMSAVEMKGATESELPVLTRDSGHMAVAAQSSWRGLLGCEAVAAM
jgi:hypothetical protein